MLPITFGICQTLALTLIICAQNLLHSSRIRNRLILAYDLLCLFQHFFRRMPLFGLLFYVKNICNPLVNSICNLFLCRQKPLLFLCLLLPDLFQLAGRLVVLPCKLFVLPYRFFAFLYEVFKHDKTFCDLIGFFMFLRFHHLHCLFMLIPLQDFLCFFQLLFLFQQLLLPLFQALLKIFQLLLTLADPILTFLNLIVPAFLVF